MNVISSNISSKDKVCGAVPVLTVIRDTEDALCVTVAAQILNLGLLNVVKSSHSCPDRMVQDLLHDAPDAGLVINIIRDAVLGPVEVSSLRRRLPGWLIIVIDHVVTADSAADALDSGADDVLSAPYHVRELEARLILRMRQAGLIQTCAAPRIPLIERANLTPIETEITHILLTQKGQIVTRNQLAQRLDKSEWNYGDRRFDVHITKIRKKLKAAFGDRYLVHTIRSQGYQLQVSDENLIT